jgi:hypothetical protein
MTQIPQCALNSQIAPIAVFRCHADDQGFNLLRGGRTTRLAPRTPVIFAGDEFAVAAQQCLRRDNRCHFRQHPSSEQPGFGGPAATLIVGQAKPPTAELSPQNSVLLAQYSMACCCC